MKILKVAQDHQNLVLSLRHYLHQHPELSDQEFETLRFLREKLDLFGVPYTEVENGGILGFLGDTSRGKTVLLRADIDALPMQEAPHNMKQPKVCPISQVSGMAHTCGHDAHTAMLLTAAKILKDHEDEIPGRIILCFERGEEGGHGIEFILRYLEKEHVQIDGCHALHVSSAIPAGKLAARYGPTTAGNFAYDITLTGKGGHGSRPDLSNNPLDCFHAFYSDLQSIWMRDVNPSEPATLAICKVQYGTTWNIIAPTLNFAGNGRFFSQETTGMAVRRRFLEILEADAKLYGCTYTINSMRGPSFGILNNKECVDTARAGIRKNLGPDVLVELEPEFASESMALMLRLYPGAYCMLGIRNPELGITANPHNPMFDIDESALVTGVAAHISYAMEFLSNDCTPVFDHFDGTVDDLLQTIPMQ
jgi:amidohydrolase